MSLGRRREKILDGEVLFKHYYISMGDGRSINKLVRFASNTFGKNPETNRDWSKGGVWQAMWRWVFDNLDYAKDIYQDVQLGYGFEFNDADWMELVSRHARTCMTNGQYAKFMRENPEYAEFEII